MKDHVNVGIPTIYRDRVFRSRLEARWAAFFDQLGWSWDYEPMDLDGWIPDFLISEKTSVLVEVKPIQEFDSSVAEKMIASSRGFPGELLLLGLGPVFSKWEVKLGWLRDGGDNEQPSTNEFAGAMMGRWKGSESTAKGDGRIGFCHEWGSYHDRITGAYDGGSYGSGSDDVPKRIRSMWQRAGNPVQWKAPEVRSRRIQQ